MYDDVIDAVTRRSDVIANSFSMHLYRIVYTALKVLLNHLFLLIFVIYQHLQNIYG